MEAHGFDVDLVLEPRLSARRAWIVASAAGGLSLILATALVLVLPLRETQVFTVLVDRQTGGGKRRFMPLARQKIGKIRKALRLFPIGPVKLEDTACRIGRGIGNLDQLLR